MIKMEDYKLDYWIESVSSSLEEIGCELSIDDITVIAEDMIISAEQESMAFGYDAIPNPLQTKMDKVHDDLKKSEDNWDDERFAYEQCIANLTGIPINKLFLTIKYGRVEYFRR
jgi:hypothetical protein